MLEKGKKCYESFRGQKLTYQYFATLVINTLTCKLIDSMEMDRSVHNSLYFPTAHVGL